MPFRARDTVSEVFEYVYTYPRAIDFPLASRTQEDTLIIDAVNMTDDLHLVCGMIAYGIIDNDIILCIAHKTSRIPVPNAPAEIVSHVNYYDSDVKPMVELIYIHPAPIGIASYVDGVVCVGGAPTTVVVQKDRDAIIADRSNLSFVICQDTATHALPAPMPGWTLEEIDEDEVCAVDANGAWIQVNWILNFDHEIIRIWTNSPMGGHASHVYKAINNETGRGYAEFVI